MSIFKKKGEVDVLDLTDLQRRGLFKVPENKQEQPIEVNSSGYVEFSQNTGSSSGWPSQGKINQTIQSSESPADGSEGGAGALGFLDSLALSGPSESPVGSGVDSLEIQSLKNKINDLEYKLRVLEDKIARLGG